MEEDDPESNLTSVVNVVAPSTFMADLAPSLIPAPAAVPGPSSTQAQAPTPVLVPVSAPVPIITVSEPLLEPPPQSDVPDEILEMLGQAKNLEEKLGNKIPIEISERWGKILLDGLAKEQKEALKDKMLIPENFLLVRAPKLNPEISAVLTEPAKNRDKRLEHSQNQLGSGIAGLVNLTKDLIQSEVPKLQVIKQLSEVAQILLNLHYEETINRRKLVLPLLDKSFWQTTQGVKRDTFLFGDKLGETIKTSKDIEKSGQQIKKPVALQQRFQRKPMSGNLRFPPRQQSTSKAAAAPNRYYEPQPSTSTRRNSSSTRQRHYKPPPAPPSKSRDRRRH